MVPSSLLFLLVMSSLLLAPARPSSPHCDAGVVQYTEQAIQLIHADIFTINLLCCRVTVAFLVSCCILFLNLLLVVGGRVKDDDDAVVVRLILLLPVVLLRRDTQDCWLEEVVSPTPMLLWVATYYCGC